MQTIKDIDRAQLEKTCALFFRVKDLIIRAEESDPNGFTFAQPSLEIKAATDHIIRALSFQYGFPFASDKAEPDYTSKQLDKAIGHLYRAYFDTAEWIVMNLRDPIRDKLKDFSNPTILAVLPDYYTTVYPDISRIENDISALRSEKDIGQNNSDHLFDRYEKISQKLMELKGRMNIAIPAMVEHDKKAKTDTQKNRLFELVKIAVAAIVSFIAGHYLRK